MGSPEGMVAGGWGYEVVDGRGQTKFSPDGLTKQMERGRRE